MLDIIFSVCEGLKHSACSSPYCLDVLPAGDTCHGSFLVFGSAVYRQQLRRDGTKPNSRSSVVFPKTALKG